MKRVLKFGNFINSINESTIRKNVKLELSRPGRNLSISRLDSKYITTINEFYNILFEPTDEIPSEDDEVLFIGSLGDRYLKSKTKSTFNIYQFKDVSKKININELVIFKLISDDIKNLKWGVAQLGVTTNLLRHVDKSAGSKRGTHFRETAFLITLSIMAWKRFGKKLNIESNKGPIEMEYYDEDGIRYCYLPDRYKTLKSNYEEYIKNRNVTESIEKQCITLLSNINRVGRLEDLKSVIKNSSKMIINQVALNLIKDEIKRRKDILSGMKDSNLLNDGNLEYLDIPDMTSIAKWNPSDIWLIFDEEYLTNFDLFNFDDIDEMNSDLLDFLENYEGIVGVSLKQSIDKTPKMIKIDKTQNFINTYNGFKISNHKKTAEIDFEYEVNKKGKIPGAGLDVRTFTSDPSAHVGIELKGKKGAGYVSGKAGALINHFLPEDKQEIKKRIRLAKTKEDLRSINYLPKNSRLKEVYLNDISGDGDKTQEENSRLQSVVFIDW